MGKSDIRPRESAVLVLNSGECPMNIHDIKNNLQTSREIDPEGYVDLLKGYKSEKDLVWELAHFTNKAIKEYKGSIKNESTKK